MVQQPRGDDGEDHIQKTDARRGENGPRRRCDAAILESYRRKINNRINTGDLLKNREPSANDQRHPRVSLEDLAPGDIAFAFRRNFLAQRVEFPRGVGIGAQTLQGIPRLVFPAMGQQPARTFRQDQHS